MSAAKIDAGCKDCEKRYVGCHSNCETYKEFKKNSIERAKAIDEYRAKHNVARWSSIQRAKARKTNKNPNGYLEVHHRNCIERRSE